MPLKSIDTPLSELTMRRYERPYALPKRELVRKFCLSVGLLQPGDSRDIVVDVLFVLLEAKREQKKLSSEEIREEVISFRQAEKLSDAGTAGSNIRRQLKRLRVLQLVEKIKNDYRISEFYPMQEIMSTKVEKLMLASILERVREYSVEIDKVFMPSQERIS